MKDLEVISKTVKINNSDEIIFSKISDMRNMSKFIPPELENWTATEDDCFFSVKGKYIKLQIVEKQPFKVVKISTVDSGSENFTVWIQLKSLTTYETAARIVVHLQANMIVRNMIKGKLQDGVNQIVEFLKYL
ncbi:MAG: hypothetical protein LBV69_04000 [Bacteroidales bacterium]|jgi:hypothetical protein|nr:hypothetical protein [Bacteroidales bacterium]